MTIIQPLNINTLESAISLAEKSFPLDFNADPDRIRTAIAVSIYPHHYPDLFDGYVVLESIRYWVALREDHVIGIIGYYTLTEDQENAAWMGWYCVDTAFRGKKIGLQLLEFIIKQVKSLGKHYLRLYSSDTPEEYRAHAIYKKIGFVPFRKPEFDLETKTILMFLQFALQTSDQADKPRDTVKFVRLIKTLHQLILNYF